MDGRLDPATLRKVLAYWAGVLRVAPSVLVDRGVTLVSREDLECVVVVELGGAVVAVHPPRLQWAVARGGAEDLVDLAALQQVLAKHAPRPIGTATLSYGDAASLRLDASAVPAGADALAEVVGACSAEDVDEAGVEGMPSLFAVPSGDGRTAAVAGYESWGGALAHVGVLVAPAYRGRGLALPAATEATRQALAAGLVPQWRCRLGNEPSERLRDRLGFVPLGRQLTVAVTC